MNREADFDPAHKARVHHYRDMLAEAWALHLEAQPDTPDAERLARLCGKLLLADANPHLL